MLNALQVTSKPFPIYTTASVLKTMIEPFLIWNFAIASLVEDTVI